MSDRCHICNQPKVLHSGVEQFCPIIATFTAAAETPSEPVPTMEWFTNVIVHLFDEGESSITELEKLAHEFLAKVRILHAAATRAASAEGPRDEALSIIDGLRRYTTHASDCAPRIPSAITCSCGLTAVTLRAIELGGGPSVGHHGPCNSPREPDADALTLETMAARLDNNALFLNDGAELRRIATRLRASAAAPAFPLTPSCGHSEGTTCSDCDPEWKAFPTTPTGTPRAVTDEEALAFVERIHIGGESLLDRRKNGGFTDVSVVRDELKGFLASRSVEATK